MSNKIAWRWLDIASCCIIQKIVLACWDDQININNKRKTTRVFSVDYNCKNSNAIFSEGKHHKGITKLKCTNKKSRQSEYKGRWVEIMWVNERVEVDGIPFASNLGDTPSRDTSFPLHKTWLRRFMFFSLRMN